MGNVLPWEPIRALLPLSLYESAWRRYGGYYAGCDVLIHVKVRVRHLGFIRGKKGGIWTKIVQNTCSFGCKNIKIYPPSKWYISKLSIYGYLGRIRVEDVLFKWMHFKDKEQAILYIHFKNELRWGLHDFWLLCTIYTSARDNWPTSQHTLALSSIYMYFNFYIHVCIYF